MADLAAFIDAEEVDPHGALHEFGQVWWHLWRCPACAETYRLTRALLEEDRQLASVVPGRTREKAGQKTLTLFHLSRRFLNFALPLPSLLGVAVRGRTPTETVMAEQVNEAGQRVTLSVGQPARSSWQIILRSTPPIVGTAVVTLGTDILPASFDVSGTAIVELRRPSTLTAADGPALVVAIASEVVPST